jgi:hypothetical protein
VAGEKDEEKERTAREEWFDPDRPKAIAGTILPPPPKQQSAALANWVLYGGDSLSSTLSSVSSVAPSYQQTSILSLEKTFEDLRDSQLHVFAHDDQPIGPRIGMTEVPEPTLKALANYERERRSRISERTWFIVGGAIATLIAGLIGFWLK